MTLGQLKTFLEAFPKDRISNYGINNPHAYRGYYDQVSFEPVGDMSIGHMLECIEEAISRPHEGWKGGEYWYNYDTPLNIAEEGMCTRDVEGWKDHLPKLLLSVANAEEKV